MEGGLDTNHVPRYPKLCKVRQNKHRQVQFIRNATPRGMDMFAMHFAFYMSLMDMIMSA